MVIIAKLALILISSINWITLIIFFVWLQILEKNPSLNLWIISFFRRCNFRRVNTSSNKTSKRIVVWFEIKIKWNHLIPNLILRFIFGNIWRYNHVNILKNMKINMSYQALFFYSRLSVQTLYPPRRKRWNWNHYNRITFSFYFYGYDCDSFKK